MRLNHVEREQFQRDGYLVRERAFSTAEVGELRVVVEDVIASVVERAQRPDAAATLTLGDGHRIQFSSRTAIQWEWDEGSRAVRLIEPFTHLHPRFAALWSDPRFVEPMKDLTGAADVSPYTCKLNLKRPREGSEFPWHQDYTYWYAFTPTTAHEIATAILFLDDVSASNGGLRVLPGSNQHGPAPRDPKDPTKFLADPLCIDASQERLVAAPAGSLLCFGSLMLHRSSPNRSGEQRRAILLSFQPAGRPRQQELTWRPELVDELP